MEGVLFELMALAADNRSQRTVMTSVQKECGSPVVWFFGSRHFSSLGLCPRGTSLDSAACGTLSCTSSITGESLMRLTPYPRFQAIGPVSSL